MYKIIKSVNTTHKGTPYRKSRRIMVDLAGGVVGPGPFALIRASSY